MKNQLAKGEAINVVLTATITAGSGLLVGSMFGVAPINGNSGDTIPLWVVGVFTLAKNSAEAWTVGQAIYWDNTNKVVTSASAAGANTKIGVATAVAANPSATGNVRLNGAF